jgi:hypothetical protein
MRAGVTAVFDEGDRGVGRTEDVILAGVKHGVQQLIGAISRQSGLLQSQARPTGPGAPQPTCFKGNQSLVLLFPFA